MTTIESFFKSIGLLLRDRLHIITAGTVQSPGVRCEWTQDLQPVGDRMVPMGELVELHVTLDKDQAIANADQVRFDILEFDWLFTGAFDDAVTSLKAPGADPPLDTDFAVVSRQVATATTTAALPTLRDVVDDFRIGHPDDYEQSILFVTDAASGVVDLVGWWRATFVPGEDAPTLYFVAEIPDHRSSSTVVLHVAPPVPGVSFRLTGTVRDSDPAAVADAQPVPAATVTVGGRSTRTTASGSFGFDLRLPLGASTLTIARPGIDTRTLTLTARERADHGFDVVVADEQSTELATGSVAANAGDQAFASAQVTVRATVHRLRGVVRWPRSTGAALPLAGRRVYAMPLAVGATAAQRPGSSRALDLLAQRQDVLRSARPDRPTAREATGPDGAFELSFVDLRAGAQYLLWVQRADPRNANAEVAEAVVRTLAAAGVRGMNGDDASQQDQSDRTLVDSRYNLLTDSVANTVEVIRVVDRAVAPAPADLRVLRPRRAEPLGIDASPPRADEVPFDAVTRRVRDLMLDVLPLVPVFETPDAQSAVARWTTRTVREQLDVRHPRGHLLGGWRRVNGVRERWASRWVLDARRADPLNTAWNSRSTLELLETTLATDCALTQAQVNDPNWVWWRIDAPSLADFADVTIPANGTFQDRRLQAELVPVLEPPVPRLTGLFAQRHVHISPGHGLFAEAPVQAANAAALAHLLSARGGWAAFGGEDESTAVAAMELVRVIRANGAVWTSSRELERLTLAGVVQTGADQFAVVQPAQVPGFPRLWQLNAYYWIATQLDPGLAAADRIVLTHSGQQTASNGQANRNSMRKNRDGINARLALFRQLAGAAVLPVDAFVAIHSNANGARSTGSSTLYLDIRATAADPIPGHHNPPGVNPVGAWIPNAAYVEDNLIGQRFAQLIQHEVRAGVPVEDHGIWSYMANGNAVAELRDSVTHLRSGDGVDDIRAHAAGGVAGLNQVNFPRVRGRDIPIGYVEMAFHTNADDVQRLAQRWFRHAFGNALAKAAETMIGENDADIAGTDLKDLLAGVFGPTAEVMAVAGGGAAVSAADVGAAIEAVTGHPSAPADAHLGTVVAAVETARDATSRRDLVNRLSRALATKAGYAVDDQAQEEAIAHAALGPLLRAAGAAEPAPNALPALADLPRSGRAPIRAEVAALIGAGLGLRPADLPTVTRPVGAVTLLTALAPDEVPEACVSLRTVDAVITAVGRLEPVDVWRPTGVRVTDARGVAVARVGAGETVLVVVELAGTAWPGAAGDVQIVVSRAGSAVARLACGTRTTATLTSAPWVVAAGNGAFSVSVQVKHPDKGMLSLAAVPGSIEVGAR